LKLLIIFNPKAAYGRSAGKLAEIKKHFEARSIDIQILSTSHPDHARELVKGTDLSGFDGLVAAGGDGTLFEVLNGLYSHPKSSRIPLGLLPTGTGNAFSRELLADQACWSDAIDILQAGKTRQIDVAQVTSADSSFHFLNAMHMGFSVDAGLVAKKLKFLGNVAYTLATLWQLLKLKSYPLEMEVDDKPVSENTIFTTIANTRYTGTHFLIAPKAIFDDGKLDVITLSKLSRFRLLKLFPTIYDGRHIEYKEVSSLKAEYIKLTSPGAMLLGPDGEFCGHTPAEIRCLHQDLTVFC
jgi:diacylglycerol kinase (ATP)